ncbi:MAG: thioredoxin domain-containing protein [Candidatus Thermoplasmatota archaeon]|jgi:thiol-disulfide isomerase/thioredoxin|nr:thioredoxin domain-containing protein [Candidatus Thermoplasmatota archaeon]
MKKKYSQKMLFFAVFFVLFSFIAQSVLADNNKVTVDFFYSSKCGSCKTKFPIVNETAEKYKDKITVNWKDIANNVTNYKEYQAISRNYSVSFPFVYIKSSFNSTVLNRQNFTVLDISRVIDAYLNGTTTNETRGQELVVDFFGYRIVVNVTSLSLPVLTIVLGCLDSFNPCAFFILIFLLNLMLYARSRRRMLLVGGVFIFFSGFWYYLFMFVLYNVLFVVGGFIDVLTIILGCIVVVLGIVNIKDFFFFKKGVSLSIPDEKKPGLFKRMRDLVKNLEITAVIFGTIVLAATVNFYELLCTSGFPLVFTNQLRLYNLSMFDSYLYIFFYNVVYVIPLIVIVLIFVFTLGRLKLSEWHGRVLKLLSGVMLVSFGVLFIVNFQLLQNVVTPVLLLVFSIVFTYVVSFIWKKKFDEKKSG